MTSYAKIVQSTRPSVFMVERCTTGAEIASDIRGTAFLVAPEEGLLVTAAHVVKDVPSASLWVRSMFNPEGLYAMGSAFVRKVFLHPALDLAVLKVSSYSTKRRTVTLGSVPPVGDIVLLFGFAHGTALTYCDKILGAGSPKSPTPLVFHAMVSAHVPEDGRAPELLVYDATTFGGNSGGPLVSTESGEIMAMHIRAAENAIGYAYPLPTIMQFVAEVRDGKVTPSTLLNEVADVSARVNTYDAAEKEAKADLVGEGLAGIDVRATLMNLLELERVEELLLIEWTPDRLKEMMREAETKIPLSECLGFVNLEAGIIPDAVPRKLEEARIKAKGEVWDIHKYDADPFPSNPHAHNSRSGLKLCLATGGLFKKRERVGTITKKDLLTVRLLAEQKDIALPPLQV